MASAIRSFRPTPPRVLPAALLILGSALAALPVAAQAISAPPAAVDAAIAHVRSAAALGASGPSEFAATSGHTSDRSGVSYVYVQQRANGIDVAEAVVSVAVARDGRIVHAAGELASGTATASRTPALSAQDALARSAALVGARVLPLGGAQTAADAQQRTVFGEVGGTPVVARLVYVLTETNGLRLSWEVQLPTPDGQHVWLVRLDAQTGAEITRWDMVIHEDFPLDPSVVPSYAPVATRSAPVGLPFAALSEALVGSYQVYAMPVEAPLWTAPAPPADARTTVANPDNALASPFGWHDTNGAAGAEFTVTRGNNVYAYTDIDNNNVPDAGSSPDGGAGLAFSFPNNLAGDPSTYRPAAVTNLFYWNNVIHDLLYQYGFTEAGGNFQQNNYGRGGVTFDDAVFAEAQDASAGTGNCNANFWTPTDSGGDNGTGLGSRPRMQMYTCDLPAGADSDGDFDNGVIVHEYGHGISNRLVGGPAITTCLQNAEQMGEGWSDWYGLMMTMDAADTRTTLRPIGNYLLGQSQSGAGIRGPGYQPAPGGPYAADMTLNTATYGSTNGAGLSQPHGIGFVWAQILWEVTWDLIGAHGFSPNLYNSAGTAGNQIMFNLVTTGLKLTPCNPGFVSGRDAILAADAQLYPDAANPGRGLHYTTLWTAFARRGLGFSASQGSTSSNADNVQAFDAPLPAGQAQVASAAISRMAGPGGTAAATIAVSNAGAPGAGNVVYSSSIQNMTFVPQARPAAPRPPVADPPSGEIVVAGVNEKGAADAPAAPAPAAALGAGGPDAFGYRWDDSNQPGGPVYAFTDIAATGTAVTLGDDASSAAITLPFSFPFYGTEYTSLFINSNGILSLGAGTTDFTNAAIPTAAAPNTFIAPYWDDLNPSTGGTIHYKTVGTDFVVQFTNIRPFSGTGAVSFQAILKPSGEIRLQYQTVPTTNNSATIGIENQTGTVGLQVAFNTVYAAPNLAVRFRGGLRWVTASNATGTVAPGAASQIGLAFDGTGLTEGTYTADLVVTTNSSTGSTTTIPLAFTVGGRATVAGAAGWRLLASPAVGMTVDNLAALNLVQGVPGFYPGVQTNLYTGYTGTAYTPSTGTGQVLGAGRGFWWYFFNQNLTPGGSSNSVALPMTLATTLPAATANVPVALHAAGTKFNLLGNPFGTSLSFTGIATWPGATNLASNVAQVWDANAATYDVSVVYPTVSPWQGFWVEGNTAGTLTIPASARTTGGVLERADPAPLVAFTLAQADGPLQDRAAALTFPEGATEGADLADAAKLAPFAGTYVSAAFEATSEDAAGALRAVESRPAPTASAVSIPLHVASVGAGEALVLSWPLVEAVPEGWALTLTDLATGTTVDLRTAASYAFTVAPEAARDPLGVSAERPAARAATAPARVVVTVGPRGATAGEGAAAAPLSLDAPRPNPARGAATIGFSLPEAGAVRLTVVDLLGREVAILADGETAAGRHTATLDASGLAPGVYVVRLASGTEALTRRVVVVR